MEALGVSPTIVRSAEAGGFVRVSQAFVAESGLDQLQLSERAFVDWLVAEDQAIFRQALEGGDGCCVVRHLTSGGDPLLLKVTVRSRSEGSVVLAQRIKSCDSPAATADTEEAEATVKGTLYRIAQIVEQQNPGYKCSILLVAHGRFVKGAGPSLPEDYNNAIDGFAVGPFVGSCGTAIYWNVPVIVDDIQADPLWAPFAELAKKAGVAACWSHPFTTKGGRVLGALALYSPEPRSPTPEQLSALAAAAQMTGLAVERGRAEAELRSAHAVKARFMANMSHEIRTPLNAIIGITDSLEEQAGEGPRSEIGLLRESGEQLLELFAGALELTEVRDRREEGEVIDLHACCAAIFEPLATTARHKGLQITCTLSRNVPQWVRIDAWSFERALKLVIHNAVKFTDSGNVTVTIDCNDSELRACVTDTGCGMDLSRVGELCQPFVQGDLSTTKRYSGFGLGLALVDLCLKALGGKLEFDANEPQGTTVRFRLPLLIAKPPGVAERAPTQATHKHNVLPVLVVEDNPLNTKVIERILTRSGYQCQCCENGEEALRAISQGAFSCILMDCQMPVMDGYEATRRIRQAEIDTGAHIPIIAVTANALAEDRKLCLQAGMDEYLKKPVRKQELVDTLVEFVGQPTAAS